MDFVRKYGFPHENGFRIEESKIYLAKISSAAFLPAGSLLKIVGDSLQLIADDVDVQAAAVLLEDYKANEGVRKQVAFGGKFIEDGVGLPVEEKFNGDGTKKIFKPTTIKRILKIVVNGVEMTHNVNYVLLEDNSIEFFEAPSAGTENVVVFGIKPVKEEVKLALYSKGIELVAPTQVGQVRAK